MLLVALLCPLISPFVEICVLCKYSIYIYIYYFGFLYRYVNLQHGNISLFLLCYLYLYIYIYVFMYSNDINNIYIFVFMYSNDINLRNASAFIRFFYMLRTYIFISVLDTQIFVCLIWYVYLAYLGTSTFYSCL